MSGRSYGGEAPGGAAPPRPSPRQSGAEGARTPDLLAASEALFQLSYSPGWERGTLPRRALGGVALGAAVLRIEDQVFGPFVADLETGGGEGLQLLEEVDGLLEPHREGRASLGEAF